MLTEKRRFLPVVFCIFILLFLVSCGSPAAETSPSPSPSVPASEAPSPTPEPSLEPTPELSPVPDPYEFGTPLEETEPVEDDSFFDDAVFLGDSRTEGLELFSGLKNGDFYWKRGMSVFRADNPDYVFDVDGDQVTLIGTLSKKTYGKVYIMIGINEMGYDASTYEEGLSEMIGKVISAQPDAVIYLQILPPVNNAVAKANGLASYINNDQVNAFNEAIVRVAAEQRVVLLNTAEIYRGEDGQLPADMTTDGAHFAYSGYTIWADYLRCHVIDPERYFYWRGQESYPQSIF